MTELSEILAAKNDALKRKILILREEYISNHEDIDERKMRRFINACLKSEISELLNLNMKPVISRVTSDKSESYLY